MTGRAGDGECRGDLVARAQRGPLSAAEQSALRAHLASCDSCRLIQQVASDFAGMRSVERGDEIRLEQMSAVARLAAGGGAQPARRRRRATPMRAAAVAAGMVLLAGTASAAVWLLPRLAWKPADRTKTTVANAVRPEAPARPARAHRSEIPQPSAPSPALPDAAATPANPPAPGPAPVVVASAHARPERSRSVRAHARDQARVDVPAQGDAVGPSASALLRAARAAANDGQADESVALYRRLQRDFPVSSEAQVGAVPLGRLLLERAATRAALAQFTRYLDAAPRGALVPEALYGRAQALARLGERQEETATWQRLVSDFPDSPYGALARRRLSEPK